MTEHGRPSFAGSVLILLAGQFACVAFAMTWGRFAANQDYYDPLYWQVGIAAALGVLLVCRLCQIASGRGHSWTWGLLGVFSLFGVAAIVCLPPRQERVRGFPIDFNRPPTPSRQSAATRFSNKEHCANDRPLQK